MLYYLSLGANLGEREQTLRRAVRMIEQQIGQVLRCSSFYYSQPWGFDSPNDFCNLCCSVDTSLSPLDVLHSTQSIERALGRTKKSSLNAQPSTLNPSPLYSDRPIDIDIIRVFDDHGEEIFINHPSSIPNDQLTIPHPLWQERDFVKVPLAEIMP